MKKLNSMKYTDAKGNRKVYSYYLTISKKLINEVGFDPNKEIKVEVKGNKIEISQQL